jgi:pyruvate/2-oxoglutarate dehydrogenase complex dihydrolipoamide acyltransferase (E2) component
VPDFAQFGPIEIKPLGRVQRISGSRLHASWVNLPHVTQFDEADITELEETRRALKAKADSAGIKLTTLAFIVRACVKALQQFPLFNTSLDASGENLVYKKYIHIGFAADTPNGLLVPVIRDADRKDIYEIARALGELSARRAAASSAAPRCRAAVSPSPAWEASAARRSRRSSMRRRWRSSAYRAPAVKPVFRDGAFVPRTDTAVVAVLRSPRDRWRQRRASPAIWRRRWRRARADRGGAVSRVHELCPDLGDFKDVPVIEVMVKPGDSIELETPLITLETDKATMDVPSTAAGTGGRSAGQQGQQGFQGHTIAGGGDRAVAAAARRRRRPLHQHQHQSRPHRRRRPPHRVQPPRRRPRRRPLPLRHRLPPRRLPRRRPRPLRPEPQARAQHATAGARRRSRRLHGGLSRRGSRAARSRWSSAGRRSAACA